MFWLLVFGIFFERWMLGRMAQSRNVHAIKRFRVGKSLVDSMILFFIGFYFEVTESPWWAPIPFFVVGTLQLTEVTNLKLLLGRVRLPRK